MTAAAQDFFGHNAMLARCRAKGEPFWVEVHAFNDNDLECGADCTVTWGWRETLSVVRELRAALGMGRKRETSRYRIEVKR